MSDSDDGQGMEDDASYQLTANDGNSKILLTPGPLTTTASVKLALPEDLGSRDQRFIETTARVRKALVNLVSGGDEYTCVPFTASGTGAIEAVIGSVILPRNKSNHQLLVLENGAYGRRIWDIAKRKGISVFLNSTPENQIISPGHLENLLKDSPSFTHVAVVHCETTTGIMNPVKELGQVVGDRTFIVDAMSSYGGVPIDIQEANIDYLIASSNKCLQGVPGISFAICKKKKLLQSIEYVDGVAWKPSSEYFDMLAQYQRFEKDGQWRFTPAIQVMLALDQAIKELHEEEGIGEERSVAARNRRYKTNQDILSMGMKAAGFRPYLEEHQGPIITTFHLPPDLDFDKFYNLLKDEGYVIYPGKVTKEDTFRVGTIGDVEPNQIRAFTDTVKMVKPRCKINE